MFHYLQGNSALASVGRRRFVSRGEQREEFNLKRNGIPGEQSVFVCFPACRTLFVIAEAPRGTHSLELKRRAQRFTMGGSRNHIHPWGHSVLGPKSTAKYLKSSINQVWGARSSISNLYLKSRCNPFSKL